MCLSFKKLQRPQELCVGNQDQRPNVRTKDCPSTPVYKSFSSTVCVGNETDIYFLLFHTIQWLSCTLRIKTNVLNMGNQALHVLDPLCTLVASPIIFSWKSQSCSQAASLIPSKVPLLRGYPPFPNQRIYAYHCFCLTVHSPANFGLSFSFQLRCVFLKKALPHPSVQIRFYCEMHSWNSVLHLCSHFDSQYNLCIFLSCLLFFTSPRQQILYSRS